MRSTRIAAVLASSTTLAIALAACSAGGEGGTGTVDDETAGPATGDITLWVAGGDTPQELRDYLVDTFAAENPGSTLTIEEQDWGDLVTKLTTALPDAENTPDVVEIGNTQSPTFTTVGAFREISPELYSELGARRGVPALGLPHVPAPARARAARPRRRPRRRGGGRCPGPAGRPPPRAEVARFSPR